MTSFEVDPRLYDRHVGRYGPQLAAALIDAAGVEPGQRALDVGSGPGALTGPLVELLGAESVVAVEPASAPAEACRARHGVTVHVAGAERLPFDDDAFDAVLSQLVVNFIADPPAGVAEMVRVARPDGVVAASVWDYAGEMRLLRAFWDAAAEVDPHAAESDEGVTMRFCSPLELEGLWSGAGLREVSVRPVEVSATWTDFEELWGAFAGGVGPSGAWCRSRDAAGQAALRDALHRRLGAPEAAFDVAARAWCAVGRPA